MNLNKGDIVEDRTGQRYRVIGEDGQMCNRWICVKIPRQMLSIHEDQLKEVKQ